MIQIFNLKENKSIQLDEKLPMINVNPNHWFDENPHFLIELMGFNFFQHARSCESCNSFQRAFGTTSTDWFIKYQEATYRILFSILQKEELTSKLEFRVNEFANGTLIKLNIDFDTVEKLQAELKDYEMKELFEKCCEIRDKIAAIL